MPAIPPTYRQHGCTVYEHRIPVPLDHNLPPSAANPNISVYAREVVRPGGEQLPYLVFFTGGPGGSAPRPGNFLDGWMGRVLKDFRLVLLDQRGTGLSTRADQQTLAELPNDSARAAWMSHFRADQIVADSEVVRQHLSGDQPWTALGQSYGGFIITSYLSLAPAGLKAAFYTGGLPGLVSIDQIYRRTYQATACRNQVFFNRYPQDEGVLRDLARHLTDTEELLPTGERLTPRRLRMLGLGLGTTTEFDLLHYFWEDPFVTVQGTRRLNTNFLHQASARLSFGGQPLYALMHESIYAGATPELAGIPTSWAAQRLREEMPGFSEFADPADLSEPYYLTGEHIYPWLFAEDPSLVSLAGTAQELAEWTDWPVLYQPDVLAKNQVPVAAAVYAEDMFVPRDLSEATAAAIRGARIWLTNQYQHDGLRAQGADVLDHLMGLIDD